MILAVENIIAQTLVDLLTKPNVKELDISQNKVVVTRKATPRKKTILDEMFEQSMYDYEHNVIHDRVFYKKANISKSAKK